MDDNQRYEAHILGLTNHDEGRSGIICRFGKLKLDGRVVSPDRIGDGMSGKGHGYAL